VVNKKALRRQHVDEKKARIFELLCNNPCAACGEDDPLVLEFDHLADKRADISKLIQSDCSWDQLRVELDKCVVLCSNCHKRKTHVESQSYRYRLLLRKDKAA
jgi:hypothetical protein